MTRVLVVVIVIITVLTTDNCTPPVGETTDGTILGFLAAASMEISSPVCDRALSCRHRGMLLAVERWMVVGGLRDRESGRVGEWESRGRWELPGRTVECQEK